MVKGQRLAQTTTAVTSAASRGRKSANKGVSATQNDIPKSKTTAMSVPSCSACGTVVTQDTRALQCDVCVNDEAWKCASCLNLSNELYDQLLLGSELKWMCNKCEPRISAPEQYDTKLDQITSMLEMLISKTDSIEEKINEKADKSDLESLEVRVQTLEADNNVTKQKVSDIKEALETLSEENKSRTDTVKDYVEKAVEVKTQESREEIDDRERRKTSVIVHGLPESTSDDKDIRSAGDAELLTNMLEELDCKDVQVMKSIRLGKYTNGMQDTTNTGSSSTEPKPRPVKLVLSSENEKNKLLKLSKNLKTIEDGVWRKVFLHQDLTVKERETRKALVLELKRRVALGEQDLAIINGKIVRKTQKH